MIEAASRHRSRCASGMSRRHVRDFARQGAEHVAPVFVDNGLRVFELHAKLRRPMLGRRRRHLQRIAIDCRRIGMALAVPASRLWRAGPADSRDRPSAPRSARPPRRSASLHSLHAMASVSTTTLSCGAAFCAASNRSRALPASPRWRALKPRPQSALRLLGARPRISIQRRSASSQRPALAA